MKRNVLVVIAACVLGSSVGGCQTCAGGNDPPGPTGQPRPVPSVTPRQIRAPLMGATSMDAAAVTVDAGH